MIIGIDPGFSGAIAFLDKTNLVAVYDLPLTTVMGRKQIDAEKLKKYIPNTRGIEYAVIEDVHAMPDQGVVSMFRFGYNAGILFGLLTGLNIKILRVKPAVWKSALGLDSNKKNSLILACKLFPHAENSFARAKDDGRAEAALIAYFAQKSL